MRQQLQVMATGIGLVLAALASGAAAQVCTASPNVSDFGTGLDNPRGLHFGPDSRLYVAEGGIEVAPNPAIGPCAQVNPPIGPYTGSATGRISRFDATGARSTVADNLPSSQTQPLPVPLVSGVGDIAFLGNNLYALYAGAGCSHGVPQVPNGVYLIKPNTAPQLVANLSAFQAANPTLVTEEDFEPDGTWYSMVAVRGDLIAVEPNHGEVDRISKDGSGWRIERIVDISARYGHVVPTAIAYDGNFYVGTLGTFEDGFAGRVIKITPSGETEVVAAGLSSILGLVVEHGRIYILENVGGFPVPCAGRVLRVDKSGHTNKALVLASGLNVPTAMTLGPDGDLYVSINGYGAPPGAGKVVRVEIGDAHGSN